jgi:glycerol-3-phosphate dehydrogenase (NAD+)
MVAALTNESATSKSVYFAHCTSEMIFITHLLAEEPEKLAGPLLADTYVTLLKGRNAWYGQMLAKGEISRDMGDSISGKGMIQVLMFIYKQFNFRDNLKWWFYLWLYQLNVQLRMTLG